MIAAFLTAFFFSLSVMFASRSVRRLGTSAANLGRMAVALLLLGVWAMLWGQGTRGASFRYFLTSGAIGFGFGDVALYQALHRVGPRLTILLNQCLAAPIAAVVEWLWLGTTMTWPQMLWSGIILSGVALAMAPERHLNISARARWTGTAFGVLAALGQALGAVFTRKANGVALAAGLHIDGGTAAFQRMIGGIAFTGSLFLLRQLWKKFRKAENPSSSAALSWHERWKKGWGWMVLNATAGPVLGIACYQHALSVLPSGVVLPIVATSPVITALLVFFTEGERPSRRAMAGGLLAVAGSIALARH